MAFFQSRVFLFDLRTTAEFASLSDYCAPAARVDSGPYHLWNLPKRLRGGDGVEAAFYFGGDLGFEIDAFPIAGGGGELWGEFFADFFFDGGVKSERGAGGDAGLVGHILRRSVRLVSQL